MFSLASLRTRHTLTCDGCEDKIYEDEVYYLVDGEIMCETCAEETMKEVFGNMAVAAKAELFGYERNSNTNPWEE